MVQAKPETDKYKIATVYDSIQIKQEDILEGMNVTSFGRIQIKMFSSCF